jgi:hypothetical protein
MSGLDISGSIIIGGIVLLVILGIFFYYTDYSQTNLANEISQRDAVTLSDIMDRDFNNVGNIFNGGINPTESIQTATATEFKFKAQMNSSAALETIRYYRSIQGADTLLIRSSDESGTASQSSWKVHKMNFIYLDASGNAAVNTSGIRSIIVNISYSNNLQDTNNENAKKTFSIPVKYQRKYFPRNLYL